MKNKIVFLIFILISLTLSFSMGVNGIWYLLFSIFIGAVILFGSFEKKIKFIIPKYLLIIPIVIFLISRFLPFYFYGPHPLGYDTGFYKYNIEKERSNSFGKLHLSEVESTGLRIMNKALISSGFSDNAILYWFYISICLLIGLMIYLLARLYFGDNAAFFSTYLYSISFIQYLFYWNIFWKNSLAIFLILLIFYLIEKGNKYYHFLAIPVIFFVFITHKTSAFLLFLTLIIFFLFKKDKIKIWLIPILFVGAVFVAWHNKETIVYLWQQLTSSFGAHYDFFSVKEGIFINGREFLNYSFLYLSFSLLGVLLMIKNRENKKRLTLVLIFSLLCAVLILAKFVFYKRIFPFLDIGLIIYFGFVFNLFVEKIISFTSLKYAKIFIIILLILPLPLYFNFVKFQKPLISKEEIQKIENLKYIDPSLRLFTYNSYYTPWLYGFSGHKVIAPGWGDDKWNLDKWNSFWSTDMKNKIKMMKNLKPPFLVYNNKDGFFHFENNDCFEKIKSHLYIFDCK